jgi:Ca2+/Na+ antiporter
MVLIILLLWLGVILFLLKINQKEKRKKPRLILLGFLLFIFFMAMGEPPIVAWVYLLGALLGIGLTIKRVNDNSPNGDKGK